MPYTIGNNYTSSEIKSYPLLAAGSTATAGAPAWVEGALVEVVPINTITNAFCLLNLISFIAPLGAADTRHQGVYNIYAGMVLVASIPFDFYIDSALGHCMEQVIPILPTKMVAANSQIRVSVACSTESLVFGGFKIQYVENLDTYTTDLIKCYPYLGTGVSPLSSTSAWVWPAAWTELVPAGTLNISDFDICAVSWLDPVAEGTVLDTRYHGVIQIGTGAAGVEVPRISIPVTFLIDTKAEHVPGKQIFTLPIPIRIAANARVAVRVTDSLAGALTWGPVKIEYVESVNRFAEVSWAEVEVPVAPRRGELSWAEFEVSTAPRAVEVSWSELEVPTPPRLGEVSWAEVEVPTAPRQVEVSWTEFESPAAPRMGEISWAEFETPDAPRACELSWSEVEVPNVPREAEVSWAELEIPLAPRSVEVSWTEFQTPTAPRGAEVSWSELEIPIAPRAVDVSWTELEVPTPPTTERCGELSWAEFEAPDAPRVAEISWSEIEVPDASRASEISWTEFELPDPLSTDRFGELSWTELEVPFPSSRCAELSWTEIEFPTAPRGAEISWAELEILGVAIPDDRSVLFALPSKLVRVIDRKRTTASFSLPDKSISIKREDKEML